jgi:hypothetical protein
VREAVGLVVQPDQLEHLGNGPLDGVPAGADDLQRGLRLTSR